MVHLMNSHKASLFFEDLNMGKSPDAHGRTGASLVGVRYDHELLVDLACG